MASNGCAGSSPAPGTWFREIWTFLIYVGSNKFIPPNLIFSKFILGAEFINLAWNPLYRNYVIKPKLIL
ncbi:MAG: hypothetical protein IT267_07115 [Saprospiraceae bacterium]|nr:hypothetical protein [Saprospiraceae bacterium]